MQKTKIEWVRNPDGSQGFTSNPISGLCPVGCKLPDGRIYCYGRRFYKRFKNRKWFNDGRAMFWVHRLAKIQKRKKPAGIFMCSTYELFHPVSVENQSLIFARNNIFKTIEACPQHRFYILTKFPQNIDREMPDNCWIGTTITNPEDFESRSYHLGKKEIKARLKFWSIEPLLGDIIEPMLDKDGSWKYIAEEEKIRWIIIGRLSGYGHKYDPKWDWINHIVSYARHYHISVFLKDNLIPIMGKEYVMKFREFPK